MLLTHIFRPLKTPSDTMAGFITNKDIVNYDFYHEDNILVVDRNNFVLDESFIDRPYHMLDENIYKKYALSNWIMEVLK